MHFGAALPLQIPVHARVERFELFLPRPGRLTLEGVRLASVAGESLAPNRVEAIPAAAKGADPARLLTGEAVTVARAERPTWRCEFAAPAAVAMVEVSNRRGEQVSANYGLCASWWGPAGEGAFDNLSHLVLMERLQELTSRLDALEQQGEAGALVRRHADLVRTALGSAQADLEALVQARREVTAAWLKQFDGLADAALPARRRRELASLWGRLAEPFLTKGVSGRAPTPEEVELAHAVLAARYSAQRRLGLSRLDELAALLRRGSLEAAEAGINRWAERLGARPERLPALITKHGLRTSVLISEETAYRDAVREVVRLMQGEGYEAALCYGALLGIVREGRFIPHDDDVDILIHARATTEEDLARELEELVERLSARGVGAKLARGMFLKVRAPCAGKPVDVFPAFNPAEGQVRLHMQRLRFRTIPAELVLPFGQIDFYGEAIAAPAQPESFLEARYGPDWRTPDRSHGTLWEPAERRGLTD